jgi:hypothetical protein
MLILLLFAGAKIIKGKRPNKKNKEAWYETMLLGYENKGYCCFILQIL